MSTITSIYGIAIPSPAIPLDEVDTVQELRRTAAYGAMSTCCMNRWILAETTGSTPLDYFYGAVSMFVTSHLRNEHRAVELATTGLLAILDILTLETEGTLYGSNSDDPYYLAGISLTLATDTDISFVHAVNAFNEQLQPHFEAQRLNDLIAA